MKISPIQSTIKSWVIVLTGALFFFYQFIQMNMFNALAKELMVTFAIDTTILGYVSAVFLLAIVVFAIPAGFLTDRFPARSLLLIAMSLSILGILIMSWSNSIMLFCLGRLLTGIAHAFCFMNAMKLACQYFPAKRLALVTGLIVTIGMLGGIVSQTPLSIILQYVSWRSAMQWDAVLGVVLLVIFWLVVFDAEDSKVTSSSFHHYLQKIPAVLKNQQNWLAGAYTGFLNLPILVLGALWGNMYLMNRGLDSQQATFVCSMLYLGTIIGSPTVGWISDKLQSRLQPMKFGAVLSTILFITVLTLPTANFSALLTLFFLLGFVSSSQVISYPLISASNPGHLNGLALSIASIVIMALGMIFQPFIGTLLDFFKNLHVHPTYQHLDFQQAFLAIAASFLISLACCYILKEKM